LKVDEAVLSPVSAPGVTDDPVATLGSRVTSELDGVVNAQTALISGEDTSVVVLPGLSIAADGQWALGECLVDGSLGTSDGDDPGDLEAGVRSAARGLAVSVLSSVGVAAFSVQTALLYYPSECFTRISSIAAIIVGVAVNNLLFGSMRN
jgi:hypothetical protein